MADEHVYFETGQLDFGIIYNRPPRWRRLLSRRARNTDRERRALITDFAQALRNPPQPLD